MSSSLAGWQAAPARILIHVRMQSKRYRWGIQSSLRYHHWQVSELPDGGRRRHPGRGQGKRGRQHLCRRHQPGTSHPLAKPLRRPPRRPALGAYRCQHTCGHAG